MEPDSRLPSLTPSQPVSTIGPDGTAWTWRYRKDFGPWLRDLRQAAQLSLRDAAAPLAISYSKLQKLERSRRARAPSLDLLGRIATLYGKDLDLVLVRAGYKIEVPQDLRDAVVCDDAFAVLMLHPQLRPACMDERWLEAFSRVQKAQIIDFARKLDQGARAGSLPTIDELIRDDDDAQAEEE